MASFEISDTKQVEVKFLQVEAGVRYWEDAEVDGVSDEDGSRIPCRMGDAWCPLIDIDSGTVENWPAGVTAGIHYKVCDEGVYTLMDADRGLVVKREGYVPAIMSPGGSGCGDYIIMTIGGDGKIADWRADLDDFADED